MYISMLLESTSCAENSQSLGSTSTLELMNRGIPTCTFDEFWRTWESGNLMDVFNRRWPASAAARLWFLETEY
jgi:hypothetical protein